MSKKLRLEVFSSNKEVKARSFHIYRFVSTKINDDKFKTIRGACRKIGNYNERIGVFDEGNRIVTTDILDNVPDNLDFKLEYVGQEELSVLEHRGIYEAYIKRMVGKKLRDIKILGKYNKYSVKNVITSSWFQKETGEYTVFDNDDKSIRLERSYAIKVNIQDDGKAYLWIDTHTIFASKRNIMDMINAGENVVGLEVKNDWSIDKQSGVIAEISGLTVVDKNDFGSSLKDYYLERKQGYRVDSIPDDTPVIKVKIRNQELSYYPQALSPVITREYVMNRYPQYSLLIDQYIKRDMRRRLEEDYKLIDDIGEIGDLDNLSFEKECCDVEKLGYRSGGVKKPELICGGGARIIPGQEYKIFNYGFYDNTQKKIKIGYLYPRGEFELCKQIANDIYCFAVRGEYHGVKDRYTKDGLLDIQAKPILSVEYDLGNITDYKRAALELRDCDDIDIVIAIIPDVYDEESPYNPFKRVWASMNIPSQMITIETAKVFKKSTKQNSNTAKFYLFNIVLGILGKVGGIPWIADMMPSGADCFIGLDVAMKDRGIHYPACSIVFDSRGKMLGFFKPKFAQSGEKITTEILQEIFDEIIISYHDKYGEKPKSIVIHRDGFSNEDNEWYEHYFKAQGIKYTIVEVRKNIGTKMIDMDSDNHNPDLGDCIYNDDRAYLVTTLMKNKKGSPNPLIIEKTHGDLSMGSIVTQILFLTQLHVGSTNKMRLPITTGYADKICKNLEFVPEGKLEKRLFFL